MNRMNHRTLPARYYTDPAIFDAEREAIFYDTWFAVSRAESIADGRWQRVQVADESVLLIRDRHGVLRGFYNVCRHRGTQLCDAANGRATSPIRCPYHAWGYAADGRLVSTPSVADDELDRDQLGLRPVHVDTWLGNVFVNLCREEPEPLRDWLAKQYDEPLVYERFGLDALRVGHQTRVSVAANWKIVIGNYNECLHCAIVHPQLVSRVPAYRTGVLYDEDAAAAGVRLAEGAVTLSEDSRSRFALIPGMTEHDEGLYFGSTVLPNMFIDITSREAVITRLFPSGPDETIIESDYLFHPTDLEREDFDCTGFVEFNETVNGQDIEVCERLQRGVGSRSFDYGVYPEKDSFVAAFEKQYLALMHD